MQLFVHDHRVALCWQISCHRTDIVLAVVGHDIVCCDEGWHITACLGRQIGVELPIVLLAISTVDGLFDILRSAVVGSNHEIPVSKDTVEVSQQSCSGIG